MPDLPSERTPGPDHAVKRPQPVLTKATAASAATSVVGLVLAVLVATGAIGADDAGNLTEALAPAITALVGAVSTVAAALKARAQVTPLSSPRNDDGHPLIEAPGLRRGPRD